ncbi:MAG: hypothetical protein K6G80_09010 [Treponema sp.]|nr:hypothetical protein [Treponema sp.]
MKKRLLAVFLLVSALTLSTAMANSLSIQVIQDYGIQKEPCSISYLVEQSVIDFFFESGAIVSNCPVRVFGSDDTVALKQALHDTLEGGMDFLVTLTVHFALDRELSDSDPMLLQYIKKVDWTIYSSVSGRALVSGTGKPNLTNGNNNEQGIVGFSSLLASQISAGLKKTR